MAAGAFARALRNSLGRYRIAPVHLRTHYEIGPARAG